MDRFVTRQPNIDRSRGPAPGAPADGLAQGMPYTAVIQSAITGGLVQVTIPALHLSQTMTAHIQPGTPCNVGESCCVEFDENKIPWVVSGAWVVPPPVVVKYPQFGVTEVTWAGAGLDATHVSIALAPEVAATARAFLTPVAAATRSIPYVVALTTSHLEVSAMGAGSVIPAAGAKQTINWQVLSP